VVGGSGGIAQELLREKYWIGNPICPTREVVTEVNSNQPSIRESLTMCRICGVLNLQGQPVDAAVGQRMMDLPWHRGPNDSGTLVLRVPTSPVQDEAS
jgi:hypothetical protein